METCGFTCSGALRGAMALATGGLKTLKELAMECVRGEFAVVDDGCSAAVVGDETVRAMEAASGISFEQEPVNVQYAFGNGSALGLYRIRIPLVYGEVRHEMLVDVVEGCLPLLLGRGYQVAIRAKVDHGIGEVGISTDGGGLVKVPLTELGSGHWMVPLRWD